MQVDGDLADVVQQRGVGPGSRPDLGLGGLVLGRRAHGQQVRLAQLERVGHDFQAMVEHAPGVCVMVAFRGGKLLHQLGVAFQRREVQGGELLARQRGPLPDVFQQALPARGGQQRRGRLRPRQPGGHRG
ncbi:hypothetical protein FHT08_000623 [Xanthomonas campestris]|nr:hypothetical protein [Xanthomonas sp. CFBP 8151]